MTEQEYSNVKCRVIIETSLLSLEKMPVEHLNDGIINEEDKSKVIRILSTWHHALSNEVDKSFRNQDYYEDPILCDVCSHECYESASFCEACGNDLSTI